MTQKEFIKKLDHYSQGTCSPADRILVEQWCDNILAKENEKTAGYSIKEREQMFEIIQAGKEKRIFMEPVRTKARWPIAAAAAILVGTLCCWLYTHYTLNNKQSTPGALASAAPREILINSTDQSVCNHTAGQILAKLPDGSTVTLFPNSTLTMIAFTPNERRMHLDGKGFFKVAYDPHRPFLVFTDRLITRVLGTSFTINAIRGSEESVAVNTGKVAVYKSSGEAGDKLPDSFVSITQNHQVRFDSLQMRLVTSIVNHPSLITPLGPEKRVSPEAGTSAGSNITMEFEDTPVDKIFKELEKSYGIKINYHINKISGCIITASLKEEDLFSRLDLVCNLIGGSYHLDGDEITVSSPGCR